jgi:hypothetical protein
MKKTIITCGIWLLLTNLAFAQNAPKGQAVKQKVVEFFGGKKALKKLRKLSYTLEKGVPNQATINEQIWVHFKRKRLKKIFTRKGQTVTQYAKNGKAWEGKGRQKRLLAKADTKRLTNVFFYNFLAMLKDPKIQWLWLKETTYQDQSVAIVRVADKTYTLDLFVAPNGKILTSSTSDDKTGEYEVFADELEYVEIGKGLKFPLVFKVYSNGMLVYQGRFKDMKVN